MWLARVTCQSSDSVQRLRLSEASAHHWIPSPDGVALKMLWNFLSFILCAMPYIPPDTRLKVVVTHLVSQVPLGCLITVWKAQRCHEPPGAMLCSWDSSWDVALPQSQRCVFATVLFSLCRTLIATWIWCVTISHDDHFHLIILKSSLGHTNKLHGSWAPILWAGKMSSSSFVRLQIKFRSRNDICVLVKLLTACCVLCCILSLSTLRRAHAPRLAYSPSTPLPRAPPLTRWRGLSQQGALAQDLS